MLLSKVDEIELWKDPGYMLGGVEIPGVGYADGADLGTPDEDMVLDRPLLPDRFTNHYEIKVDGMIGDDVTYYRYMRLHVPQENADDFLLYCWITDVIRNAATAPACIIRYEIDYWRTYLANLTFGRGTVTRCSDPTYRRPRSLQPRYRKISEIIPLNKTGTAVSTGNDEASPWVVALYVNKDADDRITKITKAFFPFDNTRFGGFGTFYENTGDLINPVYTARITMSITTVYNGQIDEAMGLDPESVIAVYISPICPSSGYVYWDANLSGGSGGWNAGLAGVKTNGGVSWIEESETFSAPEEFLFTPDGITANDVISYAITGMQGEVVGMLPYGVTITGARVSVDCGASGGYLHVAFESSIVPDGTDELGGYAMNAGPKFAGSAGLAFTVPLISVPVTSNALSSYVYSGQRDYDIENARISKDQALVNGLTGVVTGGASGGIAGAMIKSSAATAGIGALAGAAVSAGMAGVQYAVQGWIDDRLQDAKDTLYSNQTANVLIPGGSRYYVIHSQLTGQKNLHGACIVALEMDEISAGEYADDVILNGYETQIPSLDVTPFVTAGGPLRIENMYIGGEDVPYRAIAAIKDMFLRGVYIINPPEEEEP